MASPISNNVMTFMSKEDEMYVTKRDGNREIVSFDKILKRIRNIGLEAGIKINYTSLVMKVIDQLYDGISTTKIDELSAEQCASMSSIHPDYNNLAGRITISNHHKNTEPSFCDVMSMLYNYTDFHNKNKPLVSQQLYDLTLKYKKELDDICVHERDYLIEYFGFKTLERAYLMKINKVTVERPQHMWLRVAIGIHGDDLEKIIETYELMSQKYFTHATPTLFNSGTPRPQLSSCFLIAMEDDSIDGIYNTLKDCALISKWSGGIGLHIHNVRASGSHIRGTNGSSNGIVPMLKVFNNTAKYVDQCVIPESIIYTTQGPKQIQHCIAGETEIYNLNGETEVIQNVLEHSYNGEILEIETMHSIHPLKITSEHPVFVLRGEMLDTVLNKTKNSKEQLISLFEWVDAKDLTTNDMVVFPIPTLDKDVSSITEDDCYFYGLILGYGNMSNNKETTHSISINKKTDPSVSGFIVDYFNRKYVKYALNTYDDIIEIHWDRSIHLPFRYVDFYDENKKLRIQSKWINLPIHKSKFILKGLLHYDECNNKDFVFDCTSYNLIESLRFLLLKMGILSSKFCDNQNRIDYRLSIPKTREICELMNIQFKEEPVLNFYKFGSFLLDRIKNIQSNQYTGVLYDLQMGKQHDYLLHNGLVHNGGGRRNGSFAIYLEPWHADVEMFLQMRKNHGDEELKARDLFYALWIPDLFMERIKTDGSWTLMCPDECPGLSDVYGEEFVELYKKYESEGRGKKTVKARDLWFQVLDAQMETGTPYILYKDACNKKSNQKNIGIIKSSNLCVAPETLILTDEGHREIQYLEGQKVNVWNGEEYSEVEIVKTGVDQDLMDVYTDDGSKLTCTPYHKFYIQNSYSANSTNSFEQVEAKDLKPNDKIIKCDFPVIDGKETLLDNFFPSYNCSLKDKLDWFSSFCDENGTVSNNGDNKQLKISSIDYELLIKVKLLLQTCGINPKVKHTKPIEPNKNTYCILITSCDLFKLIELGLKSNKLQISECRPFDNENDKHFIKILRIEYNNRIDDTYCFTEPKRHMGIFNGIITGQCTEILEVSDENETAVCNLGSIALPAFIESTDGNPSNYFFNHDNLHSVTKVLTKNLNRIIDVNYYPTPKTERSNKRHRPIGIGVQGLADVFMMLRFPFGSDQSRQLNRDIFETIYHAALEASCELAERDGAYETFAGSPASEGILQFDMWNVTPSSRYDWASLKQCIIGVGLRNSLLLAPMPTASTSQILGYNECIEPITSNIYNRRTLAGEFILANKYLMRDLLELGLWNEKIKNNIIANHGSVQQIEQIPQEIRDIYKTVWEIPMRTLIDMAADRGAYVCQSQSLNLWLEDPNYSTLTSMHFYSWSKGLKTGIYYLRRRGRHQAQQFTIEPEKNNLGGTYEEMEDEICEMCSS